MAELNICFLEGHFKTPAAAAGGKDACKLAR
jgi:hypothetical protein